MSVTKARERFRALVCDQPYDLMLHVEEYRATKHRGVHCRYCETVHVVTSEHWKQFLSEIATSSLTQQERNEFIHAAISAISLRELYASEIERTPHWIKSVPFFDTQDKMIAAHAAALCENSKSIREHFEDNDLDTAHCSTCDKRHYVLHEDFEQFKSAIELKNSFAEFFATTPPLITGLTQSKLDAIAYTYIEKLDIRPVMVMIPKYEAFRNYACKNVIDLNKPPEWLIPRNAYYKCFHCDRCSQVHIVPVDYWKNVVDNIRTAPVNSRVKAALLSSLNKSTRNTETYCLQLAEKDAQWDSIHNEIQALQDACATIAKAQSDPKNAIHDETREMWMLELEKQYNKIMSFFSGSPTITYCITKQKTRVALDVLLTKMNALPASKLGDIFTYYNGEHLISVSELDDELLAEYYVCGRKVAHKSAVEARLNMIAFSKKKNSSVYLCSYCNSYHIGMKSQKPSTLKGTAQKGRELYLSDPVKANLFIASKA